MIFDTKKGNNYVTSYVFLIMIIIMFIVLMLILIIPRRPATNGFFAPSKFGEGAVLKKENHFFSEKTLFINHIFFFFQRSKFSVFLPKKNVIIRADKTVSGNNTI